MIVILEDIPVMGWW